LDRAIKMMADGNVNRLPVVKAGKVVGVLSRQDVIMILAGKSRS
jgi:CBS domain-containing protein